VAGLAKWKPRHVVIDPVMYAKGGAPLMAPEAVDHFIEYVLPCATVLTPNIPEAQRLADMQIDGTPAMVEAARVLAQRMQPGAAVLIKGGHAQENAGAAADEFDAERAEDILWDGSELVSIVSPRFDTPHTHGTGCTLSSAIAANLALGCSVRDAVVRGKEYVTGAIARGLGIGHGHGPTNHFHYLYQHGLQGTGPRPDDIEITVSTIDA
jgi:hydroxymethylpyrimidine/phosphomethylpyrimidine kinase